MFQKRLLSFAFLIPTLVGVRANAAMLGQLSRRLVEGSVTEARLVPLAGNTRPETKASVDEGAVPDNMALDHMLLHLNRPAQTEAAFEEYIDQQHDPTSPNYHKWLTAAQVGELYGPNQGDVDTVVSWLRAKGFVVHSVYPSGLTIDFSGTAGQVASAFHTEIHKVQFRGQEHIANMSDPEVPAALAAVVSGIVSLHDFRPHQEIKPRPEFTYPNGPATSSSSLLLVPGDIATIYNLKPLFTAGITGGGQTIAVLEDSDLYNNTSSANTDWNTFRSKFGLNQYGAGSLTTIHPGNCGDPGVNGDDVEAALDAEIASAAAPNAAIEVAACPNSGTTFGAQISLENIVNSNSTPTAISFSYGECESLNGSASNAAFNSAYQIAVSEGISVFVATGDVGAATCDNNEPSDPQGPNGSYIWAASNGINVNAYASSPYVVAVGGTDFFDTYSNTVSHYWGSNDSNYGSALSYIPEIPWNDTCANPFVSQSFGGGSTVTYGASGFCNSPGATSTQSYNYLDLAAGGGGPSTCATGDVLIEGGGADAKGCVGYPKPSWQAGLAGIVNDGVRDIPDVSLFAGDGLWGHYYVYCFTDRAHGGYPCDTNPFDWAGAGGTSFGAPLMAGIQALVNQKTGSRQGNPNYHYYQLAAKEYGSGGNTSCNSGNGSAVAGSCIFYDVTAGNTSQPCLGTVNCFDSAVSFYEGIVSFPGITVTADTLPAPGPGFPGGELRGSTDAGIYGVLSISSSAYEPAYPATTGWDFATGLGSVNAYNLANSWNTVSGASVSKSRSSDAPAAATTSNSPTGTPSSATGAPQRMPIRPRAFGTGMPRRPGGIVER